MLQRAGFADATHEQLSGGLTQLMVGTRNIA
jgi:demethylmenaquinone methyltransferase/2-methoxy-6-polyprenyl-1,4-benzoquinol methylase